MNKYSLLLIIFCLLLSNVLLACTKVDHASPDVPIYTFAPPFNEPDSSSQTKPTATSSPSSQTPQGQQEFKEYNLVVDETNNFIGFGIWPGFTEKTEVKAQGSIDFWFEYLTDEVKLAVDGTEVQRDPFHWEFKIGYTESVTGFKYEIHNTTGEVISYYLHLLPSTPGEKVAVVIHQRWD